MLENIAKQVEEIQDPDLIREEHIVSRKEAVDILKRIQQFLFPQNYRYVEERITIESLYEGMCGLIRDEEKTMDFFRFLPEIKKLVLSDLQAIYNGDPAAKSKQEVLVCYPGFYAIFIYRIAHVLYTLHVPVLPRIMTEYAHEKTGIDIHPGATIQHSFCIDHGTGIVIGETSRIGHHVKLYQGVTIGAKSFELDKDGNPVKSGKRHPDIGNHVIIYANATILGGTTHVGDYSVIGGNVWLTRSVDAHSKVINPQ